MPPTIINAGPPSATRASGASQATTGLLAQLMGQRPLAPGVYAERRGDGRRRSHSLWSFVYGGFRPRRRIGRRRGDEHHVYFDWHEPSVLYLALGIVLMSCLDALLTLNILSAGGQEVNAIMAAVLGLGSDVFIGTKLALTGGGIVVLAVVARRRLLGRVPVIWLLRLFLGGYAVLIGWEVYLLGWHITSTGPMALDVLRAWVPV